MQIHMWNVHGSVVKKKKYTETQIKILLLLKDLKAFSKQICIEMLRRWMCEGLTTYLPILPLVLLFCCCSLFLLLLLLFLGLTFGKVFQGNSFESCWLSVNEPSLPFSLPSICEIPLCLQKGKIASLGGRCSLHCLLWLVPK